MEVEHSVKVIPIDFDNPAAFQAAVNAMVSEGWELVPGVTPVAVYHVVRVKGKSAPMSAAGVGAVLHVDDSKIFVVPADQRKQ